MFVEGAPASAYIKALPNCHLRFVNEPDPLLERGKGRCNKQGYWFSCSYCHSKTLSSDMHVGLVFDSDITNIMPVREWDIRKP